MESVLMPRWQSISILSKHVIMSSPGPKGAVVVEIMHQNQLGAAGEAEDREVEVAEKVLQLGEEVVELRNSFPPHLA
jgi:hypothetical protein